MRRAATREEKIIKFRGHLDAAETLKNLIEHPAYSGFFNGMADDLTRKMLNAPIEDDETRRNCALELKTLARFREHLSNVVLRGEKAKMELEKIEKLERETANVG